VEIVVTGGGKRNRKRKAIGCSLGSTYRVNGLGGKVHVLKGEKVGSEVLGKVKRRGILSFRCNGAICKKRGGGGGGYLRCNRRGRESETSVVEGI